MSTVPTVKLNNGVEMPQLGYGVFQIPDAATEAAVGEAIAAGYRSLDTAMIYRNEGAVGRAIKASGVARDDLFVTTKVWNSDQGYDQTLRAFETSLGLLGLDRLDLYLIHWPVAGRDLYMDSWRALERLYADGRVRAIGVSNFHVPHLERVLAEGSVVPAVNQIELHPRLPQAALRAFHARHGIVTEAWSPLAQGELLDDPAIAALAAKHGKTPGQIVLRWHMQLGIVAIPKSVTPSRIRDNLDVFGFALDEADMAALGALATDERVGPDPDTFDP